MTSKKGHTKRNCNFCGKEYFADNRNLKRGWGLCCDKSCSASLRERKKPTWNARNVIRNNEIRESWNDNEDYDDYDKDVHPFSSEALGQD